MRVVKSISLPVELAKKASELPNFSVFIQECLQHGDDREAAKQREIAALKKQVQIREAALYRIIHKLNFSNSAKQKIVECLESLSIHSEDLRDF